MVFGVSFFVFGLFLFFFLAELIAVNLEDWFGSITILLVLVGFLKITTINFGIVLPSLIILIPSYFCLGILWSIVKWVTFSHSWVKRNSNFLKEEKSKFLTALNKPWDRSLSQQFIDYLFSGRGVVDLKFNNKIYPNFGAYSVRGSIIVKDNINKLCFWAIFWPFGVLAFLLKDPISWIYKFAINKIFNPIYSFITQSALNSLDSED